jgi:hypothetical protein
MMGRSCCGTCVLVMVGSFRTRRVLWCCLGAVLVVDVVV